MRLLKILTVKQNVLEQIAADEDKEADEMLRKVLDLIADYCRKMGKAKNDPK